jgi:hypothetical protein
MRKSALKSPLCSHFKFHWNEPSLVRSGGVSIAESGSLMEFLEAPGPDLFGRVGAWSCGTLWSLGRVSRSSSGFPQKVNNARATQFVETVQNCTGFKI